MKSRVLLQRIASSSTKNVRVYPKVANGRGTPSQTFQPLLLHYFSSSSHDESSSIDNKREYDRFDEEDNDGFDDDDEFDDFDSDEYPDRKRRGRSGKPGFRNFGSVNKRIWLDPNTPLVDRVNRVLTRNVGTLHPRDIILASVDLIRESGKLNSFEGMQHAHDILDRILEEKRHVNEQGDRSVVVIPEKVFKTLMYGWSNQAKHVKLAPQRMREILDLMIEEAEYDEQIKSERMKVSVKDTDEDGVFDQEQDNIFAELSCQPTVAIYNTLLQGLAEASHRSFAAAGEAEDLLRKMDKIHRNRGWHTKPNQRSFSLVINAFARTCHETAGDRAEAVLRRMIDYHAREKEAYLEETGVDYNLFDASSNKRAIVTPDAVAYSGVIQAYTMSDAEGSAEKALGLLFEVIQTDDGSLQLDAFVFANTINAFARMAAKKRGANARIAAARRAEEILWLMVDGIKRQKQDAAEQSRAADQSRAESTDEAAPTKVEIEDNDGEFEDTNVSNSQDPVGLVANVVPFNSCLNAWAQSNAKESAPNAEELLHKMLDPSIHEITGVQPDTVSFNSCLNAWAKASRDDPEAPEKAEELLRLMLDLQTSEQLDATAKPDFQSYTIVMNAYGKSSHIHKTMHARRLLNALLSNVGDMGKKKISAVPFTVLLNAAAHSPSLYDDETIDAFGESSDEQVNDPYEIALETYRELREDVHKLGVAPDHIAFAAMIDVIAQHTDPESIERRQRLEVVFKDACAAGHSSSLVVQALQKACPSTDMLQGLLQTRNRTVQTINALPREWTRNVPPQFRTVDFSGSDRQGGANRKPNERGRGCHGKQQQQRN
jgi:predicted RNase H-like HicB family nuclease